MRPLNYTRQLHQIKRLSKQKYLIWVPMKRRIRNFFWRWRIKHLICPVENNNNEYYTYVSKLCHCLPDLDNHMRGIMWLHTKNCTNKKNHLMATRIHKHIRIPYEHIHTYFWYPYIHARTHAHIHTHAHALMHIATGTCPS